MMITSSYDGEKELLQIVIAQKLSETFDGGISGGSKILHGIQLAVRRAATLSSKIHRVCPNVESNYVTDCNRIGATEG